MSDFLTNLAARSLDQVTTVRPRTALPFEDAGRLGIVRAFQSDQPLSIAGWTSPLDSSFEPDQFAFEETMVEVPARDDVERKTPPAGERIERVRAPGPEPDAIHATVEGATIEISMPNVATKSWSPSSGAKVPTGKQIERETGQRQKRESGKLGGGEKRDQGNSFLRSLSSPSDLSKQPPPDQSKEEVSFTTAPHSVIDQTFVLVPNGIAVPSLRPQASISSHSETPDGRHWRGVEKSIQNGFGIGNDHGASSAIGAQPSDRSLLAEIDFTEKKQAPGQSRSDFAGDSESINGFALRPAWTVKPIITRRDIARSGAREASNDGQATGAAQPETVVEVTIGRIEVRATQPPASAKNEGRPAAPPMMSLDDYLQQRSRMGSTGGGR